VKTDGIFTSVWWYEAYKSFSVSGTDQMKQVTEKPYINDVRDAKGVQPPKVAGAGKGADEKPRDNPVKNKEKKSVSDGILVSAERFQTHSSGIVSLNAERDARPTPANTSGISINLFSLNVKRSIFPKTDGSGIIGKDVRRLCSRWSRLNFPKLGSASCSIHAGSSRTLFLHRFSSSSNGHVTVRALSGTSAGKIYVRALKERSISSRRGSPCRIWGNCEMLFFDASNFLNLEHLEIEGGISKS
jgi:hypothetical protein